MRGSLYSFSPALVRRRHQSLTRQPCPFLEYCTFITSSTTCQQWGTIESEQPGLKYRLVDLPVGRSGQHVSGIPFVSQSECKLILFCLCNVIICFSLYMSWGGTCREGLLYNSALYTLACRRACYFLSVIAVIVIITPVVILFIVNFPPFSPKHQMILPLIHGHKY